MSQLSRTVLYIAAAGLGLIVNLLWGRKPPDTDSNWLAYAAAVAFAASFAGNLFYLMVSSTAAFNHIELYGYLQQHGEREVLKKANNPEVLGGLLARICKAGWNQKVAKNLARIAVYSLMVGIAFLLLHFGINTT